jgi:hypothetical protein
MSVCVLISCTCLCLNVGVCDINIAYVRAQRNANHVRGPPACYMFPVNV